MKIVVLLTLTLTLSRCDITFEDFFGITTLASLDFNTANDVTLDFYSADFPEKCDSTLSYTRVFTGTLLPNQAPPKDYFEFLQNRIDPNTYTNEVFVRDPRLNPLSSRVDYNQVPSQYLGADELDRVTVLWKAQHHYGAEKQAYDRPQRCQFALRLTNPHVSSKGSITTKLKQQVTYGFETDFSFQILQTSKQYNCHQLSYRECVQTVCRENYGSGFSLVIQNQANDISTLGVTYDDDMGYEGITQGLAIEFDLVSNDDKSDPSYPHVSVQYKDGSLSSDHAYSLAFAYLPSSITNSEVHNIRIRYQRLINKLDFKQQSFKITQYMAQFLSSTTADWFTDYSIGILQIFVDDMAIPVLSTPLNLGHCVKPDDHTDLDENGVVNPEMAGKAWVSMVATTNAERYGAFQLLKWTFKGVPQCPFSQIHCSNSKDISSQTFLKLTMMNIGTEKLYIKFKYHHPKLHSVSQWFDCRAPIQSLGYYEDQEIKLETSLFDPANHGCKLDIYYDGSVADLIIHDTGNSTWTSVASVYGTFDNSYLLVVSQRLQTQVNHRMRSYVLRRNQV